MELMDMVESTVLLASPDCRGDGFGLLDCDLAGFTAS